MNSTGSEWAAYIAQVNKVETAKATATASAKEESKMSEKDMMKELKRIFHVALNARREAARLGKNGITTPMSSYRCGERDALDFVLEELAQTFGFKVKEGK